MPDRSVTPPRTPSRPSDDRHCETCICGRRAPVQKHDYDYNEQTGERIKRPPGAPGVGPGTVAWSEFLQAMNEYARRYGTQQGPERMAQRGGLSWGELREFLGHEPKTWEPIR